MEPQRNVSGDADQRWFEGGDWNRGRHGAPAEGGSNYAAEEYTGEVAGHGGYGGAAPSAEPAPGSAETSRRSAEPIDVGSLRQPPQAEYPASGPPAVYPPPPAYGGGQEQPLFPSGAGGPGPAHNPLSAPTAAVHTIPPQRQPSVYQSRKPVVLVALVALSVLFEIPALRLLTSATVADAVPAGGVVAGTFLVLGIPVFAYGLYNLLGGAPVTGQVAGWLRPPLVYVPLGVLLFLFAALAAA